MGSVDQPAAPSPSLKRSIGPVLLTLYGIGVMVGAGIYVLVGEVAGQAGVFAPLAFLAAGAIAAPTAVAYAELSSRIPESAGEAAFVRRAFGRDGLSLGIGLTIACVGITSAAAVLQGGVGYLETFTTIAPNLLVIGIGLLLLAVALWGVTESLTVAAVFTVVEVVGLLVVVRAGLAGPTSIDWADADPGALLPSADLWDLLPGLGFATVLAFFAFIGFEDMVNMVEEVKRPERTMPVAILASLVITCLLYGAVTVATVRSVPIEQLAESDRPLALVYETATGGDAGFLSAIAVLAAINGVLAQMVMAARVLFGLGRRHRLLAPFHQAHPRLGTPVAATALIGVSVILAALTLELGALAEATSTFLLIVFTIVNLSLLTLKRRGPSPAFEAPMWVPALGLIGSVGALVASAVW